MDHPTNNLINDDDCDPALRLADSRECPATELCPPEPGSHLIENSESGSIWYIDSHVTCSPTDGIFTQILTPRFPYGLAAHAGISANGPIWGCSAFTAGDESSCTDTAGCSYTAAVAAVAEVADTCAAPACTFEAGDAEKSFPPPDADLAALADLCTAAGLGEPRALVRAVRLRLLFSPDARMKS